MKINNECYVSLEVAKLLKEAGFDWKCMCYYTLTNSKIHIPNDGVIAFMKKYEELFRNYNETKSPIYSAPTHAVAQRWLREVKGLFVCAIPEIKDYHATWNFYICNEQGLFYEYEDCFLTYEEALESGIKKALEMILYEMN